VADSIPIARSPIAAAPPVEVIDGWEVSVRRSSAPLRLSDCTPMTKVLLRAPAESSTAQVLDVPFGRARRLDDILVVGSGPTEWLFLGPVGSSPAADLRTGSSDDHVSTIDITHGRALVRLTGDDAARLLAKVCAIDLSDDVAPDGIAFRSSVAKVATDVIRDDVAGERSYLLHCERSSGQYFFDALLDAGDEFGIQVEGLQ
jgi:heterotetrameric sarcosine oxidase gamma subunit